MINKRILNIVLILLIIVNLLPLSNTPIIADDPPPPPEGYPITDRGLTWNEYRIDDDTYMREISTVPINYESNGEWNPINPNFEMLDPNHPAYSYGYRAGNEKGLFNTYFKPNAQDNWPLAFAYNKSDNPETHVLRSKLLGVGYLDPSSNWDYEVLQTIQNSQGNLQDDTIIYEDVFTGTDAQWIYTWKGLKEEIIMSNQTKTLLQNNPPSSFGLSNQDSYLVFYTELDYKNLLVYNGSIQEQGNFTTDGKIVFKDILDEIKFAFPIGYAYGHNYSNGSTIKEKITSRLIQHNNNYYLLCGIKVTKLNQMDFPVIIDPSFEIGAAAAPRCGYWLTEDAVYNTAWTQATGESNNTAVSDAYIGQTLGYGIRRGYIYFDVSSISTDASAVTDASISLYISGNSSGSGGEFLKLEIQNGSGHTPTVPYDYYIKNTDYNKANFFTTTCGHKKVWDHTVQNRHNVTLNATGQSHITYAINNSGWAKFIIRTNNDTYGAAPTVGGDYFIYSTGVTANPPMLYINYTMPLIYTQVNATENRTATTASLHGWINGAGAGSYTTGFWIGTSSVSRTSFDANITCADTYSTSDEFYALTSSNFTLSRGTQYYVRSWISNATFNGNSTNEEIFFTLPGEPGNLTATHWAAATINLSWSKGVGATNTEVYSRKSQSMYNWTYGTQIYNGTGTSYSNSGLSAKTDYHYLIISYAGTGNASRSTINVSTNESTACAAAYGLSASLANTTELEISWAKGAKSDRTIICKSATAYITTDSPSTTEEYNDTGTKFTDSAFVQGEYYTAWCYNGTNGSSMFSARSYLTYGEITINCFDENTSAPVNFSVFISNQDGTETYNVTNCSNPHTVDTTLCPTGNNVIIEISCNDSDRTVIPDYRSRIYILDIFEQFIYTLNAYLPEINATRLYYIQVINEQSSPVDGVNVDIMRYINESFGYEDIAKLLTDGYGQISCYLVPNEIYKLGLAKTGYITKYENFIPDPDYSGIYYPKTFMIYYEGGEYENETTYNVIMTFEGYVNVTGYVFVNYTDILNETISTNICIYEHNTTTGNVTVLVWDNRTGASNFTFNHSGDVYNCFEVVMTLAHETFENITDLFIVCGWERPYISITNKTWFDNLFDTIFGENPFGWGNIFGFFLLCGFMFGFGARNAGISLLLTGGIMLFVNVTLGITIATTILWSFFIILGLLVIWRNARKEG